MRLRVAAKNHGATAVVVMPDGWLRFTIDLDGRSVRIAHRCDASWAVDGLAIASLPIGPEGWTILQSEPLTVTPSIFCPDSNCSLHGRITEGAWVPE